MAEIYGLYSCRDGRIRYVGETTYPRMTRFEQHRRSSWSGGTRLQRWRDEWRGGFPVRQVWLEWCENRDRFARETHWINHFPDLLNERKQSCWVGLVARGARPPRIREIVEYRRGHIFNVDGRRGIHYEISTDRYCVMITGSNFEWLEGDEYKWFSDLAAAENARDRQFKFRSTA